MDKAESRSLSELPLDTNADPRPRGAHTGHEGTPDQSTSLETPKLMKALESRGSASSLLNRHDSLVPQKNSLNNQSSTDSQKILPRSRGSIDSQKSPRKNQSIDSQTNLLEPCEDVLPTDTLRCRSSIKPDPDDEEISKTVGQAEGMSGSFKLAEARDSLQNLTAHSWHTKISREPPLSFQNCMEVQESWKCLSAFDPQQLGVRFFIRFFLSYPEYRNFYPYFRSDSELSDPMVNRAELRTLSDCALFRELGSLYVDAFGAILGKLDRPRELLSLLTPIIDRHHARGVQHLHFKDMLMTLMRFVEETSGTELTLKRQACWRSALKMISEVIEEYYLHLQHKIPVVPEIEEEKDEEKEKPCPFQMLWDDIFND